MKKNIFGVMMLVAVCVGFSQNGFAKDERNGLYAGPLSVVAEKLVETAGPASKDASEPAGEVKQQYRGKTSTTEDRADEDESRSPLSAPSTPRNK
ncbi:MAG: hypothetical protein V1882_11325 [Candidatus Omnitrophota bacterium]